MFKWLYRKWCGFEKYVSSWFPGLKTKIMAFLGLVGSMAAMFNEYLQQIPGINDLLSGKKLAIASAVLFTLSFWFRNIGERVKARS